MEEQKKIIKIPEKEVSPHSIEQLIYTKRGQQVMLDRDLARLYKVETKYLKRAVKSNINRFPSDFMFELNKQEFESLRCKNCTSNNTGQRGGTRYLPFVFTEQGIKDLGKKIVAFSRMHQSPAEILTKLR